MEDPGIPIGLMVNSSLVSWTITTQRHEDTKHHKPCQMTYQKLLMFLDPGVKPLDLYHQIFPKPFHAVIQS